MTLSRLLIRTSPTYRTLSTTTSRLQSRSPWASAPAPPRLPKQDQEIFERLQSSSTGAFSTPKSTVLNKKSQSTSSTSSSSVSLEQHHEPSTLSSSKPSDQDLAAINARVEATGDGEELHPDIRRGARPEFEGDINPTTGEVGGPKNEPLRWGGNVDWSYNGRVTDF